MQPLYAYRCKQSVRSALQVPAPTLHTFRWLLHRGSRRYGGIIARSSDFEQGYSKSYNEAMTMSQLYVKDRPVPIPLSEYETRRHDRDVKDIVQAAKKRGFAEATTRESISKLETLLPAVVNLDRMKAAEWVSLLSDVNTVADKIILLKNLYPTVDILQLVQKRPKMLLQNTEYLTGNANKVKAMLAKAPDAGAIFQILPELTDAAALAQALGTIKNWYPDQDPVQLLQQNPLLLQRQGQSDIDADAEYGELSTKD